jgi:hypothetical protein
VVADHQGGGDQGRVIQMTGDANLEAQLHDL